MRCRTDCIPHDLSKRGQRGHSNDRRDRVEQKSGGEIFTFMIQRERTCAKYDRDLEKCSQKAFEDCSIKKKRLQKTYNKFVFFQTMRPHGRNWNLS